MKLIKELVRLDESQSSGMNFAIKRIKVLMKKHNPSWSKVMIDDLEQHLNKAYMAGFKQSNSSQPHDKLLAKVIKDGEKAIKDQNPDWADIMNDVGQYLEHAYNAGDSDALTLG